MTQPKNHESKAKTIKETWGKRCDRLLFFFSSTKDQNIPTIKLNISERRHNLFRKSIVSFRYIYKHHYNADWLVKADNNTFMIIDNLRHFLSRHDPSESIYFGCKYHPYVDQGYHSGSAGYVLSRSALIRLVD